jgi:transketolase
MATGSEVPLAVQAYEELKKKGTEARVVSMPSWEIFEQQPPAYREKVLPASVTRRISIEQASTFGWDRYTGSGGVSIGMKTFGVSAPLKEVLKHFGFTVEHVVQVAQDLLKRR